MRQTTRARLLIATLVLLASAGPALAQGKTDTQIGGWNLEGYVEPGVRFFLENPNGNHTPGKADGKFEEYRDINQGLYLDGLRLRLYRPDEKYSVELSGKDWGLHTQEYSLSGERLGLWQVGFEWDQMRHIYSTDAQTFLKVFGGNVFILPGTRPPLSTWNGAPGWSNSEAARGSHQDGDGEISQQWSTARVFFKLTPTPNLDIISEYTRIHKDGQRPFGMAFGSPGGIFLELVQPIDQTIHEFRTRGTYATDLYQLQWGYTASVFDNGFSWVRASNPCNPLPAPAAPCPAVGTQGQYGTTSLPPNNQAHTFNLAGGINLPLRTRVNAGVTYSLRLQNQNFQQQTYSNGLVGTNPSLQLPEKSLHGNVQTFLGNLDVTSRPLPLPLTFSLKYRVYDMVDSSHTPTFEAFVLNDQNAITSTPRRAGRYDYMRQNADLNGRYQLNRYTALTVGVGWEGWDRNSNWEVGHTDEAIAKVALDVTPADWLLVRATYQPSFRRGDGYNTNAFLKENGNVPPGFAGSASQDYQLRKFNEADRDRQKADLMVQITPIDQLSITPSVGYKFDNYVASGMQHNGNTVNLQQLGLQQAVSWSAGIDLNWTPSDRFSFATGYVHESIFQKQRQTLRNPIDPSLDWISDNTDTVETVHGAIKAALIPHKVDLLLNGSFSYALGRVQQYSPNATGSTVYNANLPNSLAARWPAFEDTYARLEAALQYHLTRSLTAKLFYAYEIFTKSNWQTDTLTPSLAGVPAVFLGQDWKNYSAQILGATLRYKFE
jgi:MtrB/PioB family decaheme-associated outer membrane protein